jgi:hypothetical protein
LKIVHIEFPSSLLTYRIRIKSTKPIERAIFVSKKSRRLAKFEETTKKQAIVVGLANEEDENGRIFLFGSENVEVEVLAELDVWITLMKVS